MKRSALLWMAGVCAFLAAPFMHADSTWVYAVQVSASVETAPPSITLNWPPDQFGASSYTVYRKSKNAGSWTQTANLPGNATRFTDNNVAVGAAYEYQIVKAGSGYTGYGYIYAGIKVPLVERQGKVILVVDSSVADDLVNELARLKKDLIGDGWTVARRDVGRGDSPANVKAQIVAEYNADPANVEAVFLFGHVPIFRCGNLNVDGHQSRPMPADAFYGDMDGGWGSPDYLPSDVELMVGRVDLWNMPGNGAPSPWGGEVQMLRNYLNKDHNWRHKQINVPRRALLGNRFGDFNGEAFAASGFRNFDALVGPGKTSIANEQDNAPVDQRWSSMLGAGTYLWAYGCGGGSYTTMSGMGTHGNYSDVWSMDIVGQDAKAVFFMMFGSWLGEWDSADNLMRSVLATPSMGLACSWAGRPHWFYHHMALGEPIGHNARVTMNNGGLYRSQINSLARGVHIALMGDPTLRMHPVGPAGSLSASIGSGGAVLNWAPSSDSVQGYHVYRAASASGPFTRVTGSLITGNSYTDGSVASGTYTYMVRAVKLESSPSGTYFNASQGMFATVNGQSGGGGNGSPPVVTVTAIDAYGSEAGSEPASFQITRSGSTTASLTVNFSLGGSAVNGTDYKSLPGAITIPAGAASKNIKVEPNDDSLNEGAQGVVLTLSANQAYTIGSPNTANISIADNDQQTPAPVFVPRVWFEDKLPAGATGYGERGDRWSWVSSPRYSGTVAHRSNLTNGIHQHYFNYATTPLNVGAGDKLFAYVYVDPANPPRQIMLQWNDGSWEHRAYWGQSLIAYGVEGTASQYRVGPLPTAGKWVRLQVPARLVGLEGTSLKGMAFTLYGGRATWDQAGKLVRQD